MKKYLPIAFFLLGIAVFSGVYFFVIKSNKTKVVEEEEDIVAEIALSQRPVTTLTPIKDGHWLKLNISGIEVKAQSLDYELLYKTKDGSTQGVPGTIKLDTAGANIERELLLGSESSGKFRYDEGVEEGTLTLRFRNEKGKLVGKLATDFHLQSGDKELTSVDSKFKYTLDKTPKGVFFVVMNTFGLPKEVSAVSEGPYGIFTESTGLTGIPKGEWTKVDNPNASSLGIYYR